MEGENQNQSEMTAKKSGSMLGKLAMIVIIVAVVAGAGYFVMQMAGGGVAVVNGQKITQTQYDDYYRQVEKLYQTQGQDTTNVDVQAAIKKQVIDDLVLEALVLQEASKEGFSANEETIDSQYTQSRDQFESEELFVSALEEQGFTLKTFRETLTKQNIFQQYLGAHVDLAAVAVTDDEIDALYEQLSSASEDIPPMSEIESELKSEVTRQKQQFLITQFVQGIRDVSEIEILEE